MAGISNPGDFEIEVAKLITSRGFEADLIKGKYINSKWKEIANAGREFTLQNYTNEKAANSLVELMRTLI